ncbi:MAG: bis(5'-nucleosyl)-tetraphosphatase (symmetrical) YqeK [Clostridiales bacterium]|nr:bis(5'-nucleosyl)-tetraphosphatase (symmetrical) YqeK [Clostridiales bacterium]
MYNVNNFKEIIKARLSEKRYRHSLCVAESARMLALKYGADADKAYISGILHDIMKEESIEVQLEYIAKAGESLTTVQKQTPQVYHQIAGAAYCALELSIDEREILAPIRFHTTGRAGMSTAEKVLYTADLISADRSYPDVEIMRQKAERDLNGAMLYALKYTINNLLANNRFVHTDTIECYNSILFQINGKE